MYCDHDFYDAYTYPETDKVYEDVLYAHMYHEVILAKMDQRALEAHMKEVAYQEEYDKQESGYYEMKELERKMDADAWEQILYRETHTGYIKDPKPYIPSYVSYVENIDKLLKAA